MKKDETLIQDEIIAYLNERKVLHWRMSGASNLAGFPDLLCCYMGYFVALEVKTLVGKPTEQQLKVIDDIRKAQGMAYLVTTVKEVETILTLIDNMVDSISNWYEASLKWNPLD